VTAAAGTAVCCHCTANGIQVGTAISPLLAVSACGPGPGPASRPTAWERAAGSLRAAPARLWRWAACQSPQAVVDSWQGRVGRGSRLRPGPGPAGSTPIPKGAGKRPGRPKAAGGLLEGGSRRAARRAPPGPGFRHCKPAWQRHQKLRADAPRKSRRSACYRASGPRPEIVPRRMLQLNIDADHLG
jgi:hypothetical protein